MAYQQQIDVLMESKQPDQDNNDDTKNCRSSIRTLQFVHNGQFIYKEICEYFQQFGRIKSMQTNFENDVHYGYIRVEMTAMDAKAILSKVSHRIADCMVNIGETNVPDDSVSIALHPLSVPTDQDATNHILVLNDDCLRNVLKRLNVSDFARAADVCVRFNQVAKDIFGKKYSNFNDHRVDFSHLKLSDIEILLRNFGPLIKSLEIDQDLLGIGTFDRTTDVLCMIAKHCHNVKKLTISYVDMNQEFKCLQTLFSKLEHLSMDEEEYDSSFAANKKRTTKYDRAKKVQDATMTYLLSACDNLKTLANYRYPIRTPLNIVQKFPSLQEASIAYYYGVDDDRLEQFFVLNPTLNKLRIYHTNYSDRSTNIYRWIGQNLVNLTELDNIYEYMDTTRIIEHSQNDIQCLSNLSKLNVLKLDFCSLSVTPLMESLATNRIPIEHLEIFWGSVDSESIKNISKLKQIKILRIGCTKMTDDYLIELAKELPLLSDLHLEHETDDEFDISAIGITKAISYANRLSRLYVDCTIRIKINMDDYNAILKSVLNRAERIKLRIHISGTVVKVNVSEAILNQNRDWLDLSRSIYHTGESEGDSDDAEMDFE